MTCILRVDTDAFVLLLYWVNLADIECKVQMERCDGSVLDTNATCPDLGQKCMQLPGSLTLSFIPLWPRKFYCTEYNMISGNYIYLGVTI